VVLKPGNVLHVVGLRPVWGCVSDCVSAAQDAEPPIKRLYQRPHSVLLMLTLPSRSFVLSVVLSIGGGIARHFTSYDVGRWEGRLVLKCR
jgi:hypothetical protein